VPASLGRLPRSGASRICGRQPGVLLVLCHPDGDRAVCTVFIKAAGDMLPLTSGAAFCWLTVVAWVLNSASNHSTLCFELAMICWTSVWSALSPGTGVPGVKPEKVP